MATTIQVKINGMEKTLKTIRGLKNRKERVAKEMNSWGQMLAREVKRSAKQAKIKTYTGTLYGNGIRWEQRENGTKGYLFMRQYAVFLDNMSPHWVSIKRTRTRLLNWALQARSARLRIGAERVANKQLPNMRVYVRPHPFIDAGVSRAKKKLPSYLKRTTRVIGG